MSWSAESPSNIALIKYIGKAKGQFTGHKIPTALARRLSSKQKEDLRSKNLSLNPSLSYTLNHFVTKTEIKESSTEGWSPFLKNPFKGRKLYISSKNIFIENQLSKSDQKKFLDFFGLLKRLFAIPGHYTVFSQNNFPAGIGSASSASSFSSLTLATYKLARDRSPLKDQIKGWTKKDLALLSRVGSGSSCRSFFSPWCLWDSASLEPVENPWKSLEHQLAVVDLQPKKIRSSLAHERVQTSPLWKGRPNRAKQRIKTLFEAFSKKDWQQCFQVSSEEFLDMHSLFETSKPPFQYKTPATQKILDCVNDFWRQNKDGPLITMDAGANVHLLYRPDQQKQKEQIAKSLPDYIWLSSFSRF